MADRPSVEEALDVMVERAEYALQLAAESYQTPDGEGEGDDFKEDPIHPYARAVVRDTFQLAVIGLFLVQVQQRKRADV